MDFLQLGLELDVGHIGPPLEEGRKCAVFYFALSAQESLALDPYNQPALYLASRDIRVFSVDLPFHGPNLNALEAIPAWAKAFEQGEDPLKPFLDHMPLVIERLIEKGLIIPEKIGFMGLSRGGLIASLVARSFSNLCGIVNFAPLTRLSCAKEFEGLNNLSAVAHYDLIQHLDTLYDQTFRFYISNRDTRVGTDRCFEFISALAETAFQKGIRSPLIEMRINPPIGHMGHGTSKEVFEHGAHFLGQKLGVLHD